MDLEPVHPEIGSAKLRVLGVNQGQGDEGVDGEADEDDDGKGMHFMARGFVHVELIDRVSGDPIPWEDGAEGELVYTALEREAMPLLRFRIKDLVRFDKDPCECGRTFLRLKGGILGRSDDMFQFSGVNIFPSAIENLIRQVEEFSNEYQIVVPKIGSGKHIKIRVEPATMDISGERMQQAVEQFIQTFKYRITVTPDIDIVEIGQLPRFELKAKRVKDERVVKGASR